MYVRHMASREVFHVEHASCFKIAIIYSSLLMSFTFQFAYLKKPVYDSHMPILSIAALTLEGCAMLITPPPPTLSK